MLGGDAVVHHQTTFAHGTEQTLRVQRQVGMADVLEHADTDHLVEAAILRDVAVVENLQLHLVLQTFVLDPLAAELELLFAQGDT
ncbi:hypothetical protein D3C76_1346700 [compost metagenome]